MAPVIVMKSLVKCKTSLIQKLTGSPSNHIETGETFCQSYEHASHTNNNAIFYSFIRFSKVC